MKTQETNKFHMVEQRSAVAFDEEINEYLDKGWTLFGEPKMQIHKISEAGTGQTIYTQAMLMTKSSMIEEG